MPPSVSVMTRRRAAAALLLTALAASCGGDDGGAGSDGFSVATLLEEIPAPVVGEQVSLTFGDFDKAAEVSGRERPGADATDEDRLTWMIRITGVPESTQDGPELTHLLPPQVVVPQQMAAADQFADELGWSVHDVTRFVEHHRPPSSFAVVEGDFDPEVLEAAMGEPVEGIWRVGPDEDGRQDLTERTIARQLGQGLRLALDGDRLAVSGHTPAVEAWLEGESDTLADDEELRAIAAALDDADVYAAMIMQADWGVGAGDADPRLAEAIERLDVDLLDPFTTLGMGLSVIDGEAVGTLVYGFASAEAAEANVATLRNLIEDGFSLRTGQPMGELVEERSIEADGHVLVASLGFPERPAGILWQLVWAEDLLTAHR